MKYTLNVMTGKVSINFTGLDSLEFHEQDFNDTVEAFLTRYGMRQFLQDAAASALKESAESGLDIEAQRREMVEEKLHMLLAGKTSLERSGGSGRTAYLLTAVVNLYKFTETEAKASLAKKSEEQIKAFAASPKIAAEIARLKQMAAQAAADRLEEAAAKTDDDLPAID